VKSSKFLEEGQKRIKRDKTSQQAIAIAAYRRTATGSTKLLGGADEGVS